MNDLIPIYKYCEDPLKNGIFKIGKEKCCCCEKDVSIYYEGPMYCKLDIKYLCPSCISTGLAAEKFDLTFVSDTLNDENIDCKCKDELYNRTPSYISWQGELWPAHCDDYCKFIGYVTWNDVKELKDKNLVDNISDVSWEEIESDMVNEGYIQGYLFQCLTCKKFILYADFN